MLLQACYGTDVSAVSFCSLLVVFCQKVHYDETQRVSPLVEISDLVQTRESLLDSMQVEVTKRSGLEQSPHEQDIGDVNVKALAHASASLDKNPEARAPFHETSTALLVNDYDRVRLTVSVRQEIS